jgi:hypothetical protein
MGRFSGSGFGQWPLRLSGGAADAAGYSGTQEAGLGDFGEGFAFAFGLGTELGDQGGFEAQGDGAASAGFAAGAGAGTAVRDDASASGFQVRLGDFGNRSEVERAVGEFRQGVEPGALGGLKRAGQPDMDQNHWNSNSKKAKKGQQRVDR